MQRISLPLLVLLSIVVSAALAWWTLTRNVAEAPASRFEHADVAPFHEIEVGGIAAVTLVQGDGESIDVDAPDRSSAIYIDVSSGRLVLRSTDRRRWWRGLLGHHVSARPAITVHFRTLDAIALNGAVHMHVPKLETPALRIAASGGSAISIDALRASSLRVEGSGALSAKISGGVDDEDVSISGAGTYRAEHLHASRASVSVSGVGNVLLRAERTLRADISGAGVIEYVGDPVVSQHVSGLGRVRRRQPSEVSSLRTAAHDHCSGAPEDAPLSLKNSGPPVTGSLSAWTPGIHRTSETRQSESSASSSPATLLTDSYG